MDEIFAESRHSAIDPIAVSASMWHDAPMLNFSVKSMGYRVVFDLTSKPENIEPAYTFYSLFIVCGVVLLVIAILLRRKYIYWGILCAFSISLILLSALLTSKDVKDTVQLRSLVERGQFKTIEGCLDYFKPGSRSSSRDWSGHERWSVRGTEFTYGPDDVRVGYHLVEPLGGAVHSDSKVRVSFVGSERHNRREIVRLAVAEGACPEAPLIDQL